MQTTKPRAPNSQVFSGEQLLQCLMSGLAARATAATHANAHSSRSHAIFTIRLRQTARRFVPAAGGYSTAAGGAYSAATGGGGGSGRSSVAHAGSVFSGSGDASRLSGGSCSYDYVEETLEAKLHLVDLAGR